MMDNDHVILAIDRLTAAVERIATAIEKKVNEDPVNKMHTILASLQGDFAALREEGETLPPPLMIPSTPTSLIYCTCMHLKEDHRGSCTKQKFGISAGLCPCEKFVQWNTGENKVEWRDGNAHDQDDVEVALGKFACRRCGKEIPQAGFCGEECKSPLFPEGCGYDS